MPLVRAVAARAEMSRAARGPIASCGSIVPFPPRRRQRGDRAQPGDQALRALGPAGGGREQARRQRQCRRRGRRRAPPDGYTSSSRSFPNAVNRFLFSNSPTTPVADFAPVTLIVRHADLDVRAELLAGALGHGVHRLRQGKPRQDHLRVLRRRHRHPPVRRVVQAHGRDRDDACALSRRRPGADRSHSGPRRSHVQQSSPRCSRWSRTARCAGLRVTTAKRVPAAPDLPTIAEAGLPGFDVAAWFAFFVPAKTPPEIVRKIHADAVAALADPAIKANARAARLSCSSARRPDEFAQLPEGRNGQVGAGHQGSRHHRHGTDNEPLP